MAKKQDYLVYDTRDEGEQIYLAKFLALAGHRTAQVDHHRMKPSITNGSNSHCVQEFTAPQSRSFSSGPFKNWAGTKPSAE